MAVVAIRKRWFASDATPTGSAPGACRPITARLMFEP
jgi:hypothetical protein